MTRIARSRRVWRGAHAVHRGHHQHAALPGRHLGHNKAHKHAKHYARPYCASCNRYFGARDELYAHVEYAHHVPYGAHGDQGLAISVSWFGWIFPD